MKYHFLYINKNLMIAKTINEAAIPMPAHRRLCDINSAQKSKTIIGRRNWETAKSTALLLKLPLITEPTNFDNIQNWTTPEAEPIINPSKASHPFRYFTDPVRVCNFFLLGTYFTLTVKKKQYVNGWYFLLYYDLFGLFSQHVTTYSTKFFETGKTHKARVTAFGIIVYRPDRNMETWI